MGIELRTVRRCSGVRWQALKRDTAFVGSWILNRDQHRFTEGFSICLGITKSGGLTKAVPSKPDGSGFSAIALRDAIAPSISHV